MNIAIDMVCLSNPVFAERGIGKCVVEWIQCLSLGFTDDVYHLFNAYGGNINNMITKDAQNINIHNFCFGDDFYCFRNDDYEQLLGGVIRNFIVNNKIDMFIIPSVFDNNIVFNANWYADVPYICVVYDLIPLVFPEEYIEKDKKYKKRYFKQIKFLKAASEIIAISACTKRDIIAYLGISELKIKVAYLGTEKRYAHGTREDVLKLGIDNKYILTVSNDSFNKNNERLIEAYSLLPKDIRKEYSLVIVFKISENRKSYFREIAKRYNVEHSVIFTGYVSEKELDALYSFAGIFAFVSLYEGFGLPLLDGIHYGLPNVASKTSALTEIATTSTVFCNPWDADSISRAIFFAIEKQDTLKGKRNPTNQFTWFNSTKTIASVIHSVNVQNTVHKPYIAYFSPLPPIRSGISDYSVELLSILAGSYNIDVYIDVDYEYELLKQDNIKVLRHTDFDINRILYEQIIFQIGNSKFHEYMFPYVEKYGGIVELHDCNLQNVLRHYSIVPNSADFAEYSRLLSYDYATEIVDIITSCTYAGKRAVINEYPTNGFITEYANKIIVHSQWASDFLRRKDCDVIPLFASVEIDRNNIDRKSLNIEEDAFILASFGIIAESKRYIQIINAFKRLKEENLTRCLRLFFVGATGDGITENNIRRLIEEHELGSSVTMVGHIDKDTFHKYMLVADVCLNLRYPYNGETSSTFNRLLLLGKKCIITDIGAFSEIPKNCCIRIPPPSAIGDNEEVDNIYQAVKKALTESTNNMMENAEKYAKEQFDSIKILNKWMNIIGNAPSNIYSKQYEKSLIADFSSYVPNKSLKKEFLRTIEFANERSVL